MIAISHVGSLAPAASFSDLQATIRGSLAPWNRAIVGDSAANVSVRLSQAVLNDPACMPEHLRSCLGEYDLKLVGFAGVNIGGGSKADVHRPDWRSEERLGFMFRAANLAAEIAQTDEFGITTSAFASRGAIDPDMPGNWAALTLNLIRVVEHLVRIRERLGITIHVDLEPEPGSLLRNTEDVVRYWQQWLIPRGVAMLSDRMPITDGTAVDAVLRHVRIALDTAHAAVVWDDPAESLDQMENAGVRIGRLQLSAAIECEVPEDIVAQADLAANLRVLESPTLLQQVGVARDGVPMGQYDDLAEAISVMPNAAGETWRVHMHAPLVVDRCGPLFTTRFATERWLMEIAARGLDVGLIEIRSANWAIVPEERRSYTAQIIEREAAWVSGVTGG